MWTIPSTLLLAAASLQTAYADFSAPTYPAPRDITGDTSLVRAAWENATATLQATLDAQNANASVGAITGLKNLTFSMGMFSLHDPAASEYQFHYTSPEIATAPNGTHKVDGDSIYRIASITKVFTVLTGLLNLKVEDWEKPLSQVLPGIENFVRTQQGKKLDPALTVRWDKVTLAALSAQLGGLTQNPYPLGELLPIAPVPDVVSQPDLVSLGFPPIAPDDPSVYPSCVVTAASCDLLEAFEFLGGQKPTFLPWTTPGYSNNGFIFLGNAIANITGKNFTQLYEDTIMEPLGMTASGSQTPPLSEWGRSVIPGDAKTNFAFDDPIGTPSGGLLSTTNDIAKFGLAVLNSTLLPTDQTRRWMKPVSLTGNLQSAVGRPWEILRYQHASGIITDVYTKAGDSGLYSSEFVLLPDFGFGFSIFSSSSQVGRFAVVAAIADLISQNVIPALLAQAQVETVENFAGIYSSSAINSTLTLTINTTADAAPGLYLSSWVSNGTEVVPFLRSQFGPGPYRLLPSIADAQDGRQAFRVVSNLDPPRRTPLPTLFSGAGIVWPDWVLVSGPSYGALPLSLFVFDLDKNGKATTAEPVAWRIKLDRKAEPGKKDLVGRYIIEGLGN